MTRASEDGEAREEVPTVSLELYARDFERFARELGEAYARYGFVILENHGIEQELIEHAMERSRAFFALEESTKKKYALPGLGGARGYTAFGVEQAKGATKPGASTGDSRGWTVVFSVRFARERERRSSRLTDG